MKEQNWDQMLFAIVMEGISAKIKRGEFLTHEQQQIKNLAPKDFKWPTQNKETPCNKATNT